MARRLAAETLPAGMRVEDFGIRGVHLAYDLLDGGYDTVVLVDALPRGERPGTVTLFEPDLGSLGTGTAPDAHAMSPAAVFAYLRALGGKPGRVLIVGLEPATVEEGIGLSPSAEAAVGEAVSMILDLVHERGGVSLRGD